MSNAAKTPLVSIAIPTYNRSSLLRRSLGSALGQTEQDVEIIVMDNGSTDDTSAVITDVAADDPRVTALRFPANQGPTRNFLRGLDLARGKYFMWLADDDWIDPTFLATCLAGHAENPTASVVAGRTLYYVGDTFSHEGEDVDVLDPDPAKRVIDFYSQVGHNGCFYGLFRRALVPRFAELTPLLGFDWLIMARAAFSGPIVTAPGAVLSRDLDPRPGYHLRYAARMGATFWQRTTPGVVLALAASRDVRSAKEHYGDLSDFERARLSARVLHTLAGRLDFSAANVVDKLRTLVTARSARG